MGMYIYKITGKIGMDNMGRKANILEFAYEPYDFYGKTYAGKDSNALNNELHRDNGGRTADRYVKTGKTFTGRVMMDNGAQSFEWSRENGGTMSGYHFDRMLQRSKQ